MAVASSPPLRWAVLHVDFDPVVGHEQGGGRRALVVSYEPFHRSGRVTVCPITAARAAVRYANEVPIPVGEAGQTRPGVIQCHQVRTVSIERASRGTIPAYPSYVTDMSIRRLVRRALQRQLGLDVPELLDLAGAYTS